MKYYVILSIAYVTIFNNLLYFKCPAVYTQVTNLVSLLFGAEHVAYSGFLELLC